MGRITVKEEDTQTTPPTGYSKLYPKEDGQWYFKDDAGTETLLTSGAHAATHKGGGSDVIDSATTTVAGLMSGTDKTKLNGIATSADVTGSNAPQAHKASHQDGGADKISVAGLSGVLADEQDAGKIKGIDVALTSVGRGQPLLYDATAGDWVNGRLPVVPYDNIKAADWSPSWDDVRDGNHFIGVNTEPAVLSHVGNGTVAYLNGISATTGDTYVVTDTGLLTAGSLGVAPGTVVMWYAGVAWVGVSPPVGGYVAAGLMVMLSTTTALISPYTDGTDDGKLIAFDGTDNTGVETSQHITITLPAVSGLANDGVIVGELYIGKFGDTGTLTVEIASSGVFFDGLSTALLEDKQDTVVLGAVNGALAQTWVRISKISDYLQLRRAATWAATNFSTATGLPWDTEDEAGNPDISDWELGTNPSRITVKYKKHFTLGGTINIDTTGGATWIFECWLRVNGTTEVPGSRVRTGNYQGEDMAVSLFGIQVALDVDDYVEWMCQHTSLTGQIYSATFTMSTTY